MNEILIGLVAVSVCMTGFFGYRMNRMQKKVRSLLDIRTELTAQAIGLANVSKEVATTRATLLTMMEGCDKV